MLLVIDSSTHQILGQLVRQRDDHLLYLSRDGYAVTTTWTAYVERVD